MTQGMYWFDPTTFDAIWQTPISGEIPGEVMFHLPEWCVYILTPGQAWQGASLNGFFAHLGYHVVDRRTELRLLLDLSGPAGDQLEAIAIGLGKGGVAGGVDLVMKEIARQFPVSVYTDVGTIERLSNDPSPLVSLVLYLSSQAAEIEEAGGGKRMPTRPLPQKTKKGMRLFPPDHPSRWQVGFRLGAALREPTLVQRLPDSTDCNGITYPNLCGGWHSAWVANGNNADARSAALTWLPPSEIAMTGVADSMRNR